MKLERIDTTAAFDDLASEWNDLLARSITDVPFLRHEYLRAWWSSLGGGEWPSAELSIVSGRDASNRLVGLAPLMCLRGGHDPSLHLLGSFEISDYLDLLVPPALAGPFMRPCWTSWPMNPSATGRHSTCITSAPLRRCAG